ncbi:Gfo/Idh/MocA family protein [candidate division KSB1 bacterium]
MKNVNILQIGYGYWGPNLTRNLAGLDGVNITALTEVVKENIDKFKGTYTDADVYKNYKEPLKREDIDAVVIATPAAFHFDMTLEALENGKHVLVEKPLALTSKEGEILVDIAEKNNRILMVGHTFLYNSAVRELKNYITNGDLGDIYYIYSHRLNLGKIRQDINSLWNFAPHDVSIILDLLSDKTPQSVTSRGFSYIQKDIEDVVFLTVEYPDSVCAHIHVSWIDPNKVRKMTIVGSKKMVVYDDVSNDAKLQIFDKGVERHYNGKDIASFESYGEFQLLLRAGDVLVPKINFVEPLKTECKHFVDCIRENKIPITDGRHGLKVVKILEAAQNSLKNHGSTIDVEL